MKKYFIYIISLFILSLSVVKADITLNMSKPIIEFPSIDNYSLQGFTVDENNLFIVLNGYDDMVSKIIVYDLESYKILKNFDYESLGHANDVTYDSKRKLIYVLAGGGSNLVYLFNTNYEYVKSLELDLPARSLTYIPDEDIFAIRTVTTGYKLNNELKLITNFPFIVGMNIRNDIGRQGWSYYNGYIYYSNWSWKRLGGDGSNFIFIYDMQGNKRDILYTKDDIGEIEDIAFYKNKMILGFNGYDNKIKFYEEDIPEVPILTEESSTDDEEIEENTDSNNNLSVLVYVLGGIFVLFIVFLIIKKVISEMNH